MDPSALSCWEYTVAEYTVACGRPRMDDSMNDFPEYDIICTGMT